MKRAITFTLAIFGVFALGAETSEKPFKILKVEQTGDLMPGPGAPKVPTTEVTVEVTSTGCTDETHFKMKFHQMPAGQFLHLKRVKEDLCEMAPHQIKLVLKSTDAKYVMNSSTSKGNSIITNPIYLANPMAVIDSTTH